MGDKILILPVGEVEPKVLAHLSAVIGERFGRECRVGPPLAVPDNAFNRERGHYAAGRIIEQLGRGQPERVLGVVDLDLYVPQLNFVFGLADQQWGRALIGLPRLRQRFYGGQEDEGLFLARAAKEAIHELGHTYGLKHCSERRCVMAFSNSLADTDFKGQEYCERCARIVHL